MRTHNTTQTRYQLHFAVQALCLLGPKLAPRCAKYSLPTGCLDREKCECKHPSSSQLSLLQKLLQKRKSVTATEGVRRTLTKIVETPAETGRLETAKEFAKRIKKVVLRVPEERLEGENVPLDSPVSD